MGRGHLQSYPLWHLLAMTGMRRGEALALRWRDVDLDAGTVSVRRSAGMVRVAGEGADVVEGDTKSGKPRVVDLDDDDGRGAARLEARARRRWRCSSPATTRWCSATSKGSTATRSMFSRQFHAGDVEALGADALPAIRLHDLRHTHATLLLPAREPVHVVSQRLGHASPMVTLTVYAHVMPGNQRETADTFAR